MPRAPKKCGDPACEERVTGVTYCAKHLSSKRGHYGGGRTYQQRKQRAEVLRLWPICYLQYDGCTQISTEDEHVVPRFEGGSDDMSNRRGVCSHCHGIKSKSEAARARRGARPA